MTLALLIRSLFTSTADDADCDSPLCALSFAGFWEEEAAPSFCFLTASFSHDSFCWARTASGETGPSEKRRPKSVTSGNMIFLVFIVVAPPTWDLINWQFVAAISHLSVRRSLRSHVISGIVVELHAPEANCQGRSIWLKSVVIAFHRCRQALVRPARAGTRVRAMRSPHRATSVVGGWRLLLSRLAPLDWW